MAWLSGYKYRKPLWLAGGKIKTLTNFPGYVILPADADIGTLAGDLANGSDLKFTAADGVTKLSYQKHKFAVAAGAASIIFPVLFPALVADVHLPFYVYFGKASDSDESTTAVWDGDTVGVWPFKEGSGSAVADMTATPANGTLAQTDHWTASGIVGSAYDFDAVDDNVSCGTPAKLNDLTTLTVEALVNPRSDGGGDYGRIVDKLAGTVGWDWYVNGAVILGMGFLRYYTGTAKGGWSSSTGFPVIGAANHVAVTHTGDLVDPIFYANGVLRATSEFWTPSDTLKADAANTFYVGNRNTAANGFDGIIDEVIVSKVVRSADWILTRANNLISPATFIVAGALETGPRSVSIRGGLL